jgi:hypothetical protein
VGLKTQPICHIQDTMEPLPHTGDSVDEPCAWMLYIIIKLVGLALELWFNATCLKIDTHCTQIQSRYIYLVRDDPKLPDDSGHVPKPNGVVGNSILGRENVSLLDEKLARWSSASCFSKKNKTKIQSRGFFVRIQCFWFSYNSCWILGPTKHAQLVEKSYEY